MTRSGFIRLLEKKGYSYEIGGDKIVVTHKGVVYLDSITSLPSGVVFKNEGGVNLPTLTSLPPGVVFKNGGYVDLNALTSLSSGVEFKNGGNVLLESLTSLPPGVEFENGGDVHLGALTGGWFSDWNGNIEGINSKRLLNKMIKDEYLKDD